MSVYSMCRAEDGATEEALPLACCLILERPLA